MTATWIDGNGKVLRKGTTEYILIFLAWFEHEEYASTPPPGWHPNEAIRKMGEQF